LQNGFLKNCAKPDQNSSDGMRIFARKNYKIAFQHFKGKKKRKTI
jgi:hypothetical protein